MIDSTARMTSEKVAELWNEAVDSSYQEECSDKYAPCLNCGVQFKAHDEYDCEVDGDDDDDDFNMDDWQGFEAATFAYLDREALQAGTVTNAFIKAFEASRSTPLDKLPVYPSDAERNPVRALQDCFLSEEIPEDADIVTLKLALEWAEQWKNAMSTAS